jgi:hypothetical protein
MHTQRSWASQLGHDRPAFPKTLAFMVIFVLSTVTTLASPPETTTVDTVSATVSLSNLDHLHPKGSGMRWRV